MRKVTTYDGRTSSDNNIAHMDTPTVVHVS